MHISGYTIMKKYMVKCSNNKTSNYLAFSSGYGHNFKQKCEEFWMNSDQNYLYIS